MRLRARLIAREHKADIVVVQGEDMTLASPVASSYSKNASARDVQRVIYRNPSDLARDRIAAGRDPVQSAPTPFTFARLGIAVDCRTGASLDAVLLLTVAREGELLGLARQEPIRIMSVEARGTRHRYDPARRRILSGRQQRQAHPQQRQRDDGDRNRTQNRPLVRHGPLPVFAGGCPDRQAIRLDRSSGLRSAPLGHVATIMDKSK